jgi:glycerophosphoryl diester phosphodiesterase
VELDVRISSSGELLVRHDPLVPTGGTLGREGAAGTVPTLAAALDACGAEMLVNVEIKNLASDGGFDASMTIAHDTIDELRRRGSGQSGRWLVSSFSWATLAACRDYAGDVATAYLCMALDDERIERVAAAGHAAVHPWERLVTEPLVERCHAAGLLVNVWTSNDPERLVERAALGVDGVCTDVPAIARNALGRRPVASRDRPHAW